MVDDYFSKQNGVCPVNMFNVCSNMFNVKYKTRFMDDGRTNDGRPPHTNSSSDTTNGTKI